MSNLALKIKKNLVVPQAKKYPSTRFMGSKEKILEHIWAVASRFEFDSVLDLFSGSGVVSYMFKSHGKKVISNDYMSMSHSFTKALIENNSTTLTETDLEIIFNPKNKKDNFVEKKFSGLYFKKEDNIFIDTIRGSVYNLENEYKKHLIISCLTRACLKRRPRGIFTYTGFRYDDGRRDLQLSLKEHFLEAVDLYNNAVFDNRKSNFSYNENSLDFKETADLVYLDPPYYSKHSDNDYIRRYHFVEGLAQDWDDVNFQEHTKTKKFLSYDSPFRKKETTYQAFEQLIEKYSSKILLISYSSNSLPDKDDLMDMMRRHFDNVEVVGIDYKYSFGNQSHKIDNNNNDVSEYIFIGYQNKDKK